MKYRKKPVVIDAFQLTGNPMPTLVWASLFAEEMRWEVDGNDILIPTLEGVMRATPGDWVIRGIKGEFYPCKPDIFEATYERVE